jgi:hypothetical protein
LPYGDRRGEEIPVYHACACMRLSRQRRMHVRRVVGAAQALKAGSEETERPSNACYQLTRQLTPVRR